MRQPEFQVRRSATVMLIVANVLAFLVECAVYGYPPRFSGMDYFALSWAGLRHGFVWQLVTFQFLHAGFLHLLFNCIAIYVFGRQLEQVLGVKRFLTLYFSSGILGGLLQALAGGFIYLLPGSVWASHFAGPAVGASAGAMGLVAAFALLYPEQHLVMFFYFIPVPMRAKFLLLLEAIVAVFSILFPVNNVANAAHLGGIAAGILFIRYAIHWEWRWPEFRRRRAQAPHRLVRVSAGSSALWGRNRVRGDDDVPEESLNREVDSILDKIFGPWNSKPHRPRTPHPRSGSRPDEQAVVACSRLRSWRRPLSRRYAATAFLPTRNTPSSSDLATHWSRTSRPCWPSSCRTSAGVWR